jgi:hypothetical protein
MNHPMFADPPLDSDEPHDEIARLEERIEQLTESLERCRKIALASRLALAGGVLWIVLMLTMVLPFIPFNIVGAIAALLGGTVMLGSNASTWTQIEAALAATQARRNELIGLIDLRLVREARVLH